MKHRLSKITTKVGDKGTTLLGNGEPVEKDSLRIEVIGDIDELNSAIGVVLASQVLREDIKTVLINIQHDLFCLAGELSVPDKIIINHDFISRLEKTHEKLNSELSPLEEFILPGGNADAAMCHLARSICRRAERHIVSILKKEKLNQHSIIYLNRLSDLLFVIARAINKDSNVQEVLWKSK